jgi:hypothetical protein
MSSNYFPQYLAFVEAVFFDVRTELLNIAYVKCTLQSLNTITHLYDTIFRNYTLRPGIMKSGACSTFGR